MKLFRTTLTLLCLFLALSLCAHASLSKLPSTNFYVNYDADNPPQPDLLAFDLNILDGYAEVDLTLPHQYGRIVLGYISIGELDADSRHRKEALKLQIPLKGKNPNWGSDLVDIRSEKWHDFIVHTVAKRIVDRGFDGFLLDTVDTAEALGEKDPDHAQEYWEATQTLIRKLKKAYPDKYIVINRGFEILPEIHKDIDGVLAEDLFTSYHFKSKTYGDATPQDHEWLLNHLNKAKELGLPVYVVDYVTPLDKAKARTVAQKIRDLGFTPFVTTIELDGTLLAPVTRHPRRILCLFGQDPKIQGPKAVQWPADSFTYLGYQAILEYLGYEVHYQNVLKSFPKQNLNGTYCAVIPDLFLSLTPTQETQLSAWLIQQARLGKKIILIQQSPFQNELTTQNFYKQLGISFPKRTRLFGIPIAFPIQSDQTNFETKLIQRPEEYAILKAPKHSTIDIRATIQETTPGKAPSPQPSQHGAQADTDLVFTTLWGGAIFYPYTFFYRPDGIGLMYINPFSFFQRALEGPNSKPWPMVDTTTRDGLRIFYSHVDGDGFTDKSFAQHGKLSAEVIHNQIYSKYPLPVTASIIEADVRGWLKQHEKGDAKKFLKIAKEIFKEPNVEIASHTATHPFLWMLDDTKDEDFVGYRLELKPEDNVPYSIEREVKGSIDFINQELAPKNKKVKMILWSGNCRPGPEAVKFADEIGILNMNGGDTLYSTQKKGLSMLSPRYITWNNRLQVHAQNQNDYVYTDEWKGPDYSGFLNVIDTFEKTETPNRLKPVNVYYHYFSGSRPDALTSLKQIYRWVLSQPLHAMWTSEYTKLLEDARITELYEDEITGTWTIINHGFQRTYRMENTELLPDLYASQGVTGYEAHGKDLYIHTNGSPIVKLKLAKNPKAHLHLQTSTAEITFKSLTSNRASFHVQDLRPICVTFGGIAPHRRTTVTINGRRRTFKADSSGTITLKLPKEAQVEIKS